MSAERRTGELADLVVEAAQRVRLDLAGRVVLTEAATGPYAATSVLAALAGADEVHAWTRAGPYGSVDAVRDQTFALADRCGVRHRITITADRPVESVQRADIVTNSGHVRPIDAEFVAQMKPGAVVPLMFEAWEIQAGRFDVDLAALRARGIAVAGTNERHPDVGVFDFLAPMAAMALQDAGVELSGADLALLCDNPFEPYLTGGLEAAGAGSVTTAVQVADLDPPATPDALVVSMRPTGAPVLDDGSVAMLAARWPGLPVVQFWGDLDRSVLRSAGVRTWPASDPPPGHMAVLPSAVGPAPVVRLQAGGLKVAEVLLRAPALRSAADTEYLDEL